MRTQHIILEIPGRLYIEDSTGEIAHMDYSDAQGAGFIVSSTYVKPAYRDRGLAKDLLDAMADKARAMGVRIVPLCPYVRWQFAQRDEYADVAAP